MTRRLFILVAGLLLSSCLAAGQTITTIAGGGSSVLSRSGHPLNAPFGWIEAVATDRQGNLYFADRGNAIIVKIRKDGLYEVVAGNGEYKATGDGGPATRAAIGGIKALTVDQAGNLYLSDGKIVRRIGTDGIIQTIAGISAPLEFGAEVRDGIPATEAVFRSIADLAVDASGNLYVADAGDGRIKRIDDRGIVTTFAGGGKGLPGSAVSDPMFVRTNANGSLSFMCLLNPDGSGVKPGTAPPNTPITKSLCDEAASFSGEDVPAAQAKLYYPMGLAIDRAGNVYIADSQNHRIRKVDRAGIIRTIAGNGHQGSAANGEDALKTPLTAPHGITVDAEGNVFIAEYAINRIDKITPDGRIFAVAGTAGAGAKGDEGPAIKAQLNFPSALSLSPDGILYVADTNNARVRKITPDGIIRTASGNGQFRRSGDGGLAVNAVISRPAAVAVDQSGNVFFTDRANHQVRKIDTAGYISTVAGNGAYGFTRDGGLAGEASLGYPTGVAVDAAGNIYIAEVGNDRVRRVRTNGVMETFAGNGKRDYDLKDCRNAPALDISIAGPEALAVGRDGTVFVSTFNAVYRITPDQRATLLFKKNVHFSDGIDIEREARGGGFEGIAVDQEGRVYLALNGDNQIVQIDKDGKDRAIAGNAKGGGPRSGRALKVNLGYPKGIAVAPRGDVYFSTGDAIYRAGNDGRVSLVAGSSESGFSGDQGPADAARLKNPLGLAIDRAGNLYVADSANDRIRKVHFAK